MKVFVYDFPDACYLPAFLDDFNAICRSLANDDYPHIMGERLTVDTSLHTDAPGTMVIICKPDHPKETQMLGKDEVMFTLEIAATIEELATKYGITVPNTEPVMQVH
jgi:hypothetical protein